MKDNRSDEDLIRVIVGQNEGSPLRHIAQLGETCRFQTIR